MAFGPDFYEDEAAESPKESKSSSRSGSKAVQTESKKGAYIGLFIGLVLAAFGFLYESIINPDAEGIVKLIMFGVALVGAIVFIVFVKKVQR